MSGLFQELNIIGHYNTYNGAWLAPREVFPLYAVKVIPQLNGLIFEVRSPDPEDKDPKRFMRRLPKALEKIILGDFKSELIKDRSGGGGGGA